MEKVGLEVEVGLSSQQLKKADAVALPGVGSFPAAAGKLDSVKQELIDIVESGVPLLGICLGFQLFFPKSEEGTGKGLSLFEGKNIGLPSSVKVPHMGWNTLEIVRQNEFFDGIEDGSYVYFVHSLYPAPDNKRIVCTETNYGVTFTSAVAVRNIYGTQFHPEKSGDTGIRILENFARIVAR